MFDQSGVENTFRFFYVGRFHSSFTLVKYPYTKTTHEFSPDWPNTHLFLLYYHMTNIDFTKYKCNVMYEYNNDMILRALYLINSLASMISSLGLLIIDGGLFNQV